MDGVCCHVLFLIMCPDAVADKLYLKAKPVNTIYPNTYLDLCCLRPRDPTPAKSALLHWLSDSSVERFTLLSATVGGRCVGWAMALHPRLYDLVRLWRNNEPLKFVECDVIPAAGAAALAGAHSDREQRRCRASLIFERWCLDHF